jgi:hypothetical protein
MIAEEETYLVHTGSHPVFHRLSKCELLCSAISILLPSEGAQGPGRDRPSITGCTARTGRMVYPQKARQMVDFHSEQCHLEHQW